ncbi:MAG: hypothetical protein IT303_06180 [Dehalococcoidia bacterium]|nr:hypothetical protein [Dehalococcoidia bacterium]
MRGRLGPIPYLFTFAAGLAAVAAFTLFWARSVVLDQDEFAARAAEAAEDDSVKQEIARVVVDKLIEAEPVLRVSRPVLDRAAAVAVQTRTFERTVEPAARDLHETAFDEGRQELVLDFTELVDLIVAELDRIENRIDIIDLELDSRAGEVALEDIEELRTAARTAETADTATPIVPIVAIALLALGVLVAGRLAIALGGFALGAVLGAAGVWVSLVFLRARMDSSFDDDNTRDAANVAWDVYMDPLPLLLIGVAVLAIATAVVGVIAAKAVARRAPASPDAAGDWA